MSKIELPNLKNLISGGLEGIGNAAANIIGKLKADPTKVAEAEKELAELQVNAKLESERIANESEKIANERFKLEMEAEKAKIEDIANARAMHIAISSNEKISWLNRNIAGILVIVVTVGFFGLLIYMLQYEVPKSNERIMDILLGSLGTAWVTMINFYFGSSIGSHSKEKQLSKLSK